MNTEMEDLKILLDKIDECDDLIVEISQLRYWLEDAIKQIARKNPQLQQLLKQTEYENYI